VYRKEGAKRGKVRRREKTREVKTFSVLARPLTSACGCLCRHRVRAHPASSAAIKRPFPARMIASRYYTIDYFVGRLECVLL